MKLYITAGSVFVLVLFYLPVVLFVLWRIARSKRLSRLGKAFILPLFLFVAYAIPLWDVTQNSFAMAKVCPTAGLHVYKQVKVEGYFDRSASEQVLERYPYRFIEYTRPGEKITRLERDSTGTISKSIHDTPMSEYQVEYEDWKLDRTLKAFVLRDVIKHTATSQVVGERLLFNPIPGWVDRVLVLRWFGGAIQGCHGKKDYEFRSKILIPKGA